MESAIFKIDELSGKHTAKLVKQTLEMLPGIASFCIDQNTDCIAVDFHSAGISHQTIKNKLIHLGLGVTSEVKPHQKHIKSKQSKKEKPVQPFPDQNPNTAHNTKKEALGPNTKR